MPVSRSLVLSLSLSVCHVKGTTEKHMRDMSQEENGIIIKERPVELRF